MSNTYYTVYNFITGIHSRPVKNYKAALLLARMQSVMFAQFDPQEEIDGVITANGIDVLRVFSHVVTKS